MAICLRRERDGQPEEAGRYEGCAHRHCSPAIARKLGIKLAYLFLREISLDTECAVVALLLSSTAHMRRDYKGFLLCDASFAFCLPSTGTAARPKLHSMTSSYDQALL